ncbi:hypothetical protein C7J99_24350 [Brevibacillus brevis]|nr:hypothetical protein C7J99_24350 [Brevibacillus brevis]
MLQICIHKSLSSYKKGGYRVETIFQEAATTILELSKGVGVDVTAFIVPDKGFSIIEWWEEVVSCMTLSELEEYIVSAPQGSSNSDLVTNLKNIVIKQRDLLRQEQGKGVELYA